MGNAAVSLEDLLYRAHKFIFDKPLATRSPHLSIEILIVYKRQRYIRKSLCIRPELSSPILTNGLYLGVLCLFLVEINTYIERA